MSKNCCIIPWLYKHTPRCTYTNKSQWINVEKQPAALHPSAKKKGRIPIGSKGLVYLPTFTIKKSTIHVGEYTRPGYYGIIFIKAPSFPFFKRQVSTGNRRNRDSKWHLWRGMSHHNRRNLKCNTPGGWWKNPLPQWGTITSWWFFTNPSEKNIRQSNWVHLYESSGWT